MMCLGLLASCVLPLTVNAAGMILFSDDFSVEDEANWDYADSSFDVIDGKLEGYSEAVCHQSQYLKEYDGDNDGNKKWGSGICFKVDVCAYDDDHGSGNNSVYLWWADYFADENDEYDDDKSRIIYKFGYNFGKKELFLNGDFEGDSAKPYLKDPEDETPRLDTKEGVEYKMDLAKPDVLTLGMRISKSGVITCYCDDKLIFTYQAERGASCGTTKRSPVLLYNNGSYCAWDNFVLATEDYNLFNESAVTEPAVTDPAQTDPASPVTQAPDTTAIQEVVVTEIGDDGEVVTKIETVIVTNAPTPDTQKQPTNPQGGAQTGDMAVIVIAVMAVALGAAVVVKKVNE